MSETDEDSDKI